MIPTNLIDVTQVADTIKAEKCHREADGYLDIANMTQETDGDVEKFIQMALACLRSCPKCTEDEVQKGFMEVLKSRRLPAL